MTHEEFYSSAFLACLPIAAQACISLGGDRSKIVEQAHDMAVDAVAHWQEQLKYVHQREAQK